MNFCSKFKSSKSLHECKDEISSCFSEKMSFHTDDRNKVCLQYVRGCGSQELRVGWIYFHIHCKQASPFSEPLFLYQYFLERETNFNSLHAGWFFMLLQFVYWHFSKINFQKKFQEHYQSVKQFELLAFSQSCGSILLSIWIHSVGGKKCGSSWSRSTVKPV